MDGLHACFAFIDYITLVAKFQFPNEPILELEGENIAQKVELFHVIKHVS